MAFGLLGLTRDAVKEDVESIKCGRREQEPALLLDATLNLKQDVLIIQVALLREIFLAALQLPIQSLFHTASMADPMYPFLEEALN